MLSSKNRLSINAIWGPRPQTPPNLAQNLIILIDRLRQIHPSLERWWFCEHDGTVKPVPQKPEELTNRIEPDSSRERLQGAGVSYQCELRNMPGGTTSWAAMSVELSAWPDWGWSVASFSPALVGEPDPAFYNFDICHDVLIAMIETLRPDLAKAWPEALAAIWVRDYGLSIFRLNPAWMTYVGPRLEPLLNPLPNAIKEDLPGGGVLLSATRDRFDVTNPSRVTAARAIAASGDSFRSVQDNPFDM